MQKVRLTLSCQPLPPRAKDMRVGFFISTLFKDLRYTRSQLFVCNAIFGGFVKKPFFRYILGVESPLICDILPQADEHGLMADTIFQEGTDDDNLDQVHQVLSFQHDNPPE